MNKFILIALSALCGNAMATTVADQERIHRQVREYARSEQVQRVERLDEEQRERRFVRGYEAKLNHRRQRGGFYRDRR